MDNSKAAKTYALALQNTDLAEMARFLKKDVEVQYPQSGEIFLGRDNYLEMLTHHPGGLPKTDLPSLSGDMSTVHVTSPLPFGMPQISVIGSGDVFVVEGTAE